MAGAVWARQRTPDLDKVMGNPALRSLRQSLGAQQSHRWTLQGPAGRSTGSWVTPFALKGSHFALSQCIDERHQVRTHAGGTISRGDLLFYTAWFTRDAGGTVRIANYSWFAVHTCG